LYGGRNRNSSGDGGGTGSHTSYFSQEFLLLDHKISIHAGFCRIAQVFDCMFVSKGFAYFNVTASEENISATF
jgi:hypothetical protein